MFANELFESGCRQKLNVYIRRHQGAKCAREVVLILKAPITNAADDSFQ